MSIEMGVIRAGNGYRFHKGSEGVDLSAAQLAQLVRSISAFKFDSDVEEAARRNAPTAVTIHMHYDDYARGGEQATPSFAALFQCASIGAAQSLIQQAEDDIARSTDDRLAARRLSDLFEFDVPPYPEDEFDLDHPMNRRSAEPNDPCNEFRVTVLALLGWNYKHLTSGEFWTRIEATEPELYGLIQESFDEVI